MSAIEGKMGRPIAIATPTTCRQTRNSQLLTWTKPAIKNRIDFLSLAFLTVPNTNQLYMSLRRVRDQIKGLADSGRKRRIKLLREQENIDELFQFAYRPSSFELKFNKISEENIRYFQDLLTILARKTDVCFTALVIDRKDPAYRHRTLLDMYKIVTHKYFNFRCKEKCVFAPDDFDTGLSWDQVVRSDKIAALMPMESHSSLALQCCDVLAGTIGLALKDRGEHTKRDQVRLPMVATFEQEFGCKITSSFTVNKPRYVSVWTLDFSKVRTK